MCPNIQILCARISKFFDYKLPSGNCTTLDANITTVSHVDCVCPKHGNNTTTLRIWWLIYPWFICDFVLYFSGPDYMANFSPGWNFVAITWRTSVRASLGTKYEIASEESRENQAAILFPAFQPGLKFLFDYMRFFQPGAQFSPFM